MSVTLDGSPVIESVQRHVAAQPVKMLCVLIFHAPHVPVFAGIPRFTSTGRTRLSPQREFRQQLYARNGDLSTKFFAASSYHALLFIQSTTGLVPMQALFLVSFGSRPRQAVAHFQQRCTPRCTFRACGWPKDAKMM